MVEATLKVSIVGFILLVFLAGVGAALPKITEQQAGAIEAAFSWDTETRNHAVERHPEDQDLADWCESNPGKIVMFLVTKKDPRGLPVKYNELCMVMGPDGIITIIKPFLRAGNVFQLLTRYRHEILTSAEQINRYVTNHGAPGYQILLTQEQLMELLK